MDYEHKGIAITFLEGSGEFVATKDGQTMISASLAGIKKQIDKTNTFQRFTVLVWRGAQVERETVVGKRMKGPRTWGTQVEYLRFTGGNEESARYLYIDTPENESKLTALVELWKQHNAETDALRNRHDAENKAARAGLKTLSGKEDE